MARLSNKMRRLLEYRPSDADMRGLMFWLVDVIFACRESEMVPEAAHLHTALGHLGIFLENNQADLLDLAFKELKKFENLIDQRKRADANVA